MLLVEIDGTSAGANANGLVINGDGSGSLVRGLVINRFGSDGVVLDASSGTSIVGNFIGTDTNGTLALGNGAIGVFLNGADNNTIGGVSPAARNIISGNNTAGVDVDFVSGGNLLQGNFIGIDATGSRALGNHAAGVRIKDGSSNDTVGGTTAGAGNFISGNGNAGIFLDFAGGSLVQGNFIGTDTTGTSLLGNSSDGILIFESLNNTIGGTAPGRVMSSPSTTATV